MRLEKIKPLENCLVNLFSPVISNEESSVFIHFFSIEFRARIFILMDIMIFSSYNPKKYLTCIYNPFS